MLVSVRDHHADAFGSVAGSFEDANGGLAKFQFETVGDGDVREGGSGLRAHVDGRAGTGGEFTVAGDEVGVEMAFENVADGHAVIGGGFQIEFDVTLRIDDDGFAFGSEHVGSMGQTAEIELFEVHG